MLGKITVGALVVVSLIAGTATGLSAEPTEVEGIQAALDASLSVDTMCAT